jgi:hypothetical protein
MAISSRWKREYRVLKDHVAQNPEIRIDQHMVYIPEDLRGRFYEYFDDVRRSVVRSWDGPLCSEARSLAENYAESEKKLHEALNLGIELPKDLSIFLHDPEAGMMRLIYSRLFELVQEKMSEDDFERMAEGDLAANAAEMFRTGYEAWAALTLVLLLEPDEIFGVVLDEKNEPRVAGIDRIAFGRQFHHPAKRIPEFIIHSRKTGGYVAFKMPLTIEVSAYVLPDEIPTERLLRKRNGDSSAAIGRRMVFLSAVPDIEKPPIFANLHKRSIHGPDITVEFAAERDLLYTETVRQAQNRVEIMKPHLGSIMALMDTGSKSEPISIEGNMEVFPVGLDRSKLRQIVDKLILKTF